MKIAMVALSGGMDSAASLLKISTNGNYDVVAAHHVKLLTREGVDRVQSEIKACREIFLWFSSKNMRFTLTQSEYECLYDNTSETPDLVMLAPIVTQALLAEVSKHEDVEYVHLVMGDHKDEFDRGPAFTYRFELLERIFASITNTFYKDSGHQPYCSVIVPNRYNTKQEIYEYLPPDLRDLTSSCRKGRNCGNCNPCLDIEAIQERLKRE
jgi:7-cyano-7-deazaguanine synthase in queuosine biosynthesis